MAKATNYVIIDEDTWDISRHICEHFVIPPGSEKETKLGTLTYNRQKFYLKTPPMLAPFGASMGGIPGSYVWNLNLMFGDNPKFLEKACQLDKFMINTAFSNCFEWLGMDKLYSYDVVETKLSPMVKHGEKHDGSKFGFLETSFSHNDHGSFDCLFYDQDGDEIIDVSDDRKNSVYIGKIIPPMCYCSVVLSANTWADCIGFGVSWHIEHIMVFSPHREYYPIISDGNTQRRTKYDGSRLTESVF